MHRAAASIGGVLAVMAMAAAATAGAQERQVYRYTDTDGRVVYSDRPPAGEAKNLQAKRIGANYVETSEVSYATRQATEKYPVTLYTFACGEVCQNAEGLLNRRGVPFSTVNVEDAQGAQKLTELTGEANAPVLQVGDKLIAKGFNDARWQALLDQAGYPKTPAAKRTAVKPAGEPAAAKAEPDVPPPVVSTLPAKGGGYPK
jgi:glutaredoxin